ncbi:MAG: agmatine deiminase family protein [Leptolyngbyaceae cyanobacterium]
MLVREADYDLAAQKCGLSVNLVIWPLDDLWMRDTGLVFVQRDRRNIAGLDFNFNGWGTTEWHSSE